MGVVLPAFIPPIVSALVSLLLLPENPAPLAYASGTLGSYSNKRLSVYSPFLTS